MKIRFQCLQGPVLRVRIILFLLIKACAVAMQSRPTDAAPLLEAQSIPARGPLLRTTRDEQPNYRHSCTSPDHVQTDFWHVITCQGCDGDLVMEFPRRNTTHSEHHFTEAEGSTLLTPQPRGSPAHSSTGSYQIPQKRSPLSSRVETAIFSCIFSAMYPSLHGYALLSVS